MKKHLASLLTLTLLAASCTFSTPTPPADIQTQTASPDPFIAPWEDLSIYENGLIESEHYILGELHGASVYRIELTIEDSLYEITGSEQVRYTNTEAVPLENVQFRLFPNILGGEMKVSNVAVNETPVSAKYGLQNSLMIVPINPPLQPGQSIMIQMDYEVTVPQSLDQNYGVLAYADDVLALAHAYPMIAVYDDEGWNAEIPPPDGDVTYSDIAFYLVRVHAPKGLTLVTSGREISREETGQDQVLTVANGPARDFYLAASYEYEEIANTSGEITIRSYARKESEDGSRFAVETARHALEIFGKRYTPYPYTEIDIVQTPTLALGIEYPGAIAITDQIYNVDGEYRGTPSSIYLESTVAHEVGHQWFYGLVGDDQLDDPWLDESLTQFATLQYYTDLYGQSGADGFRASLEDRWARVPDKSIPIGLPVAGYSGLEYGAIVYGRGPLFFVALRDQMGNEAFDLFLKDYVTTFAWSIATPQGLQSLAEKHCSCDLDPIFAEWVYP